MKKRILVPIDFEQQSILNLEWAKFYAKFNNSEIILTHIIEETSFLKKIFKQENFEEKIRKEVADNLKDIAKEHFSSSEQYLCEISTGKAYEEIEKLTEKFEPEMVILGKNENQIKGRRLGSNTLHVINETDYPVVTIYGTQKPENLNNVILLPLDLTKPIANQADVAVEYAKIFGAKIKAITVNNEESVAHKSNLLTKMNNLKDFFEKNKIDCEIEIIEDYETNPATIINEIAEKLKPIFVIIMTRNESNIKQFFIGSIAKEIIENCNAPVLSVKPWEIDGNENLIFEAVYDPLNIF